MKAGELLEVEESPNLFWTLAYGAGWLAVLFVVAVVLRLALPVGEVIYERANCEWDPAVRKWFGGPVRPHDSLGCEGWDD